MHLLVPPHVVIGTISLLSLHPSASYLFKKSSSDLTCSDRWLAFYVTFSLTILPLHVLLGWMHVSLPLIWEGTLLFSSYLAHNEARGSVLFFYDYVHPFLSRIHNALESRAEALVIHHASNESWTEEGPEE